MTPQSISEGKKPPTSFLDLPAELRNKIYHLILPTDQVFEVETNVPKSPNLVEVSGRVGDEASDIYYGSNAFMISNISEMRVFLDLVDHEKRHFIQRLEFPHWWLDRSISRGYEHYFSAMCYLNIHLRRLAGVRPEAVFVARPMRAQPSVRLTEEQSIAVIERDPGGWQLRPNLGHGDLKSAWEDYTASKHFRVRDWT